MEEQSSNEEPTSSNTTKASLTQMMPPEVRGFVANYWGQAKVILFSPQVFFRTMPTEGGYKDPLLFLAVSAGVNAVLAGLMSLQLPLIGLIFIASLIAVFVGSAVACFLSQAMSGKGNYEATFRVIAYSEATLLFVWLPILGLVPALYTLVLNYIGLKQVHQLSEIKTASVVLLTGLLTGIVLLLTACSMVLRSIFHF
ncbi:MAG: YIP1 family protein [Candidatus Melainabacteria bacterium]|nr:YIP1 family protein [Candidatus Melainabacteria bacterium]